MPRFAFPPLKQVSAVAEAASPPTAISKATSIFEFSQLSEDHESPLTAGYNATSLADAGSDGIDRDSQQDDITCRPSARCSRLLFHSNRTPPRRECGRQLEPGSNRYAFSSTSARLRTASSPTVAEEPPHPPITKRFRQTMLSKSGRIAYAHEQLAAASDGWGQIKRARGGRRSVADRRQLRSMLNGVKRLDAATIDRMYTKGDIDILLGPKAFSKKEKKAMSKNEMILVLIRLIQEGLLYTEDEKSPSQPIRHETSDEEDEYSSEAEIEDGSEVEDEDFEEETRPRRTTCRTLCADERMHVLPNIRLVLRGIRLPKMLQEASAVLPSQPALPSTPPSIPSDAAALTDKHAESAPTQAIQAAAPARQLPATASIQRAPVPPATPAQTAPPTAPAQQRSPSAQTQSFPHGTLSHPVTASDPSAQALQTLHVQPVSPGMLSLPYPDAIPTLYLQHMPPGTPSKQNCHAPASLHQRVPPLAPSATLQPVPPATSSVPIQPDAQPSAPAGPTQRVSPVTPTQQATPATSSQRATPSATTTPRVPPAADPRPDPPDISTHKAATTQRIPPATPSQSAPHAMVTQEILPATRQHSAAAILLAATSVQEALHATPPREAQPATSQSILYASASSPSLRSVSRTASFQVVPAIQREDHPAATTQISSTTASQQQPTSPLPNLLPTPEHQISQPATTPSQTISHCCQTIQPRVESSLQAHATILARGQLASSELFPYSEEQLKGARDHSVTTEAARTSPSEARTSAWSFQLATNSCLNTGPQKLLLTPDESALLTQLRQSVKPYWPDFSSIWLDFNQMPRVKLTLRPSTTCATSRSCSPRIDSMDCSEHAASTAREQESHFLVAAPSGKSQSSPMETSFLIEEDSPSLCWDSSLETVHLWREDLSVFDHVEWQPIISQLREATLDVGTAYHKVAKAGVRQMLLHAPDGSSWWLRQAGMLNQHENTSPRVMSDDLPTSYLPKNETSGTGAGGTIIRESGTRGKYRKHRSWRSARAALVEEIRPGMCCFTVKEAADGSLMLRAPSGKVVAAPAHMRKPTADAIHEVGVGTVSACPSSSQLAGAPPPSSLLLVDKSPYTTLMDDSISSSQLVEDPRSSSLLWEGQSHYPMQVSEFSSSSQLDETPAQLLLEDHRQYPQPMEDAISSPQAVERPLPSSLLLVDRSTGSIHMDASLMSTPPPVEDSLPDAMLVDQVPPHSPSSRARQARVLRLMKQLQRCDNSIKFSGERSETMSISSSSDPPASSTAPSSQLSRHESIASSHVAAENISQAETQTWPRQCPELAEYAASRAQIASCLEDSSPSSAGAGSADEASFSMQQHRALSNTTVSRAGVVGDVSLSTQRDKPSTLGGGVKAAEDEGKEPVRLRKATQHPAPQPVACGVPTPAAHLPSSPPRLVEAAPACAEMPEKQMPSVPGNAAEQTEPALAPGAEKTVALSNCTEGWIRWHRPQATTPPGAQRRPPGVTITPAAEKPRRSTRQAARLPVGRTAKAAAKAGPILPGERTQCLPEEQRSVCSDATELSSTAHPELVALLQFADEMDLTDILQCC